MKIIEPSADIIEKELAGLSVCQRIDRCASVCYQRPPKPTEEDAEAFCRHLIERGHLPALEMAVVHLAMPWACAIDFEGEKYLSVSRTTEGMRVVSGSVRAFMEAVKNEYHSVFEFLSRHLPLFFHPTDPDPEGIDATAFAGRVRFATPDEIPWQHKHVAVLVVCSRAISHQLVRHRPCSFLQESQRLCRYDDGVTFIRPEWAEDGLEADYFETQCYSSEAMYKSRRNAGLSPQQARGALIHDVKTELIIYASLPEWLHIFDMRCAKAADPEVRRIMVSLREQFRAEYPDILASACGYTVPPVDDGDDDPVVHIVPDKTSRSTLPRKTRSDQEMTRTKKPPRMERNARAVWGGIATAMEQVAEAVEAGDQGRVVVTFRYRRKGVCGIEVSNQVEKRDGD